VDVVVFIASEEEALRINQESVLLGDVKKKLVKA